MPRKPLFLCSVDTYACAVWWEGGGIRRMGCVWGGQCTAGGHQAVGLGLGLDLVDAWGQGTTALMVGGCDGGHRGGQGRGAWGGSAACGPAQRRQRRRGAGLHGWCTVRVTAAGGRAGSHCAHTGTWRVTLHSR